MEMDMPMEDGEMGQDDSPKPPNIDHRNIYQGQDIYGRDI